MVTKLYHVTEFPKFYCAPPNPLNLQETVASRAGTDSAAGTAHITPDLHECIYSGKNKTKQQQVSVVVGLSSWW